MNTFLHAGYAATATEDLRRAERAKLSHEELEKLGFEEPY